MKQNPSDEPVRITGEERLHPALRKLGRACIALARWQREQDITPAETATEPPTTEQTATTGTPTPPGTGTPRAAAPPDQEPRHD